MGGRRVRGWEKEERLRGESAHPPARAREAGVDVAGRKLGNGNATSNRKLLSSAQHSDGLKVFFPCVRHRRKSFFFWKGCSLEVEYSF